MPVPQETSFVLKPQELLIQTTKGTGPGGQHRNKTESAVRARHLPTGIEVFIDGRDQHQNKKKALKILASRVSDFYQQQKDREYNNVKKSQLGGGGRSNKVRTYNFTKSRVVDHVLNTKTTQIDRVMKGEFELILAR